MATNITAAVAKARHRSMVAAALPPPRERRHIRTTARLSQSDVAAALGVSRQAVSRWEDGSRYPGTRYAAPYADLLARLHDLTTEGETASKGIHDG